MNRTRALILLLHVAAALQACTESSGPNGRTAVTRVAVTFAAEPLKVLDSGGVTTAVISCGPRCRIRNVEWSEDGEMLAMTANLDSASALLVSNRDGSGLREIARVPATIAVGPKGSTSLQFFDFQQAWSSDNRLAYANKGLVISAADGTARRTLLPGVDPLRPRWTPRDSAITYINGASSQLEIIGINGSTSRRLVTLPGDVTGQAWSPDGGMLAISATEAGEGELYVLDSRTSSTRQLAAMSITSSLCWSPDSRRISFVHAEGLSVSSSYATTASIIGSDGSHLIDIAAIPRFLTARVSWSSNGASLLFSSDDPQLLTNILVADPTPGTMTRTFTTERGIGYFAVSGVRCSYLFNL